MKKLLILKFLILYAVIAYGQQLNNTNTKFPNGLAPGNGTTNPTTGVTPGMLFFKTSVGYQYWDGSAWQTFGIAGSGVTSFSAGNLSPLFTTSVATATTTPALTFSLSNVAANTIFGNNTSGSAAPGFQTSLSLSGSGTFGSTVKGTKAILTTVTAGTAGTDSLLVKKSSDNTTYKISPTYYATATAPFTISTPNTVANANGATISGSAVFRLNKVSATSPGILTTSTDTIAGTKQFTGTVVAPVINGGTAANDDITIQGTSNATRTTSYVILQPTGGNVGIGTTIPSMPLSVRSAPSAGDVQVHFQSNSGTNVAYGGLGALNSAGSVGYFTVGDASYTPATYYAKANWLTMGGGTGVGLRFGANARLDDMVIDTAGRVGIGTTTFIGAEKLRVNGNVTSTGTLKGTGAILTAVGGVSGGTDSLLSKNATTNLITKIPASYYATSTTAFVQNGNSFGADAYLGTNDAYGLLFKTNNTARINLTNAGNFVADNWNINANGSGQFSSGAITWDTSGNFNMDGNLVLFGGGTNTLNADGSGLLGNGGIQWDVAGLIKQNPLQYNNTVGTGSFSGNQIPSVNWVTANTFSNPMTTEGDMIYRNATVPARLAIGTAGQLIKVNAGATAPEYFTGGVLTIGTHLTGTSYSILGNTTIATDATNANTASTIVSRDASGNFTAGTITAALTGHASLDATIASPTFTGTVSSPITRLTNVSGVTGGTDSLLSKNATTNVITKIPASYYATSSTPFSITTPNTVANANGATISAGVFRLNKVSATSPGIWTTSTDTVTGNKYFDLSINMYGANPNIYLGQSTGTGGNVPSLYSYSANGTYYSSYNLDNSGNVQWNPAGTTRMTLSQAGVLRNTVNVSTPTYIATAVSAGTAGTDSVIVKKSSDNKLYKISPTYYATATGGTGYINNQNGSTLAAQTAKFWVSDTIKTSGKIIGLGTIAITGHTTFEGVTSTGATGTGNLVYSASPTFTGTPAAPTAAAGDNSTTLATTAYADARTSAIIPYACNTVFSPADGATDFFGGYIGIAVSTVGGARKVYPNKAVTITSVNMEVFTTGGASSENCSIYIRVNNTTDNLVTSTFPINGGASTFNNINVTGLSIAIGATDYYEVKLLCPTWATNPTGLLVSGTVGMK